jgi:hypothetical protein
VVGEAAPRTFSRLVFYPDTSAFVGDSVNLAMGETKYGVKLTALDGANNPISGVIGYVTSSDTTIAKPGSPWTSGGSAYIIGQRVGTALMTATSFVYGVARTDTFRIHVGYPIRATVSVIGSRTFDGGFNWYANGLNTSVGPGATITFENNSSLGGAPGGPIDVTFDNPAAALPAPSTPTGAGNITALPADTGYAGQTARRQNRMFAAPGTFTFHVPNYHLDGAIVVKPTP